MCKISVIIPVYNVEEYIETCLKSIEEQTFEDFEAIIVNDGSKQNEKEIILKYVEKDGRFRYIEKENGGQGSARNLGVREAKGEYVFFVDSDDYIDRECLRKLYTCAVSENKEIVLCDLFTVNNGTNIYTETNKFYCEDYKKNYLLNASSPCCKLIRRELILENELYFPEGIIYEDVAIMGAFAMFMNKIGYVHEALYYYILRDGSTMKQMVYNKKLESVFPALENLRTIFEKNGQSDKYKAELEYIYVSHMLHDASLRFFAFDEGRTQLEKIVDMIKKYYPEWMKNEYFKKESWKYKVVTILFYFKQYRLLNMILK